VREVFDRRNLIYGESSFLFQILESPYLIIALGDYHDGPLLDTSRLLFVPDEVFFAPVYNENQLRSALKQGMERDLPIVLLNIDRLFTFSNFSSLNNILHALLNKYSNAVFITTSAMKSKQFPPPPNAPHYVRHLVDVVVFARRLTSSFALYLVKHPYLPYSKFVWRFSYGKELSLLPFISPDINKGC